MARDINRQIEQRIQAFAQELNQLVRQAALEAVQDALGGQRTARPTSTSARPAAKATRGRRGAGGRRSPGQMEQMMASVRDYVAANPGTRMEKLSAAVGASTAELRLPVLKLLEQGTIRKQGEKRATEYFPGNGRAQGSRKRSTAKKARRRRAAR